MMKMNHWIVTGAIVIGWLAVSSAWAVTDTWDGSANQSWANNGNWEDGSHPSNGGNTWDAIFHTSGAGNLVNCLGANHTVRSLTFNDNVNSMVTIYLRSVVSNSSGSQRNLTFNSNSGDATLTVASGATGAIRFVGHQNSNLVLQDNLIIDHDGSGVMDVEKPFTGAYHITKQGAGTVLLDNGNMNAATAININGGQLRTSAANKLNDAAPVTMTGGTLTLGGNENIGSLGGSGGTVALGANNLSTGSLNTDTVFAGEITGSPGNMTKAGTGTMTLTGANTFSGWIAINSGGTLQLAADDTLSGNNAIMMNNGTLAVSNDVDCTLGTLYVGNNPVSITCASGSTLAFEDSSGVTWLVGTLAVTGTFGSSASGISQITFGSNGSALTAAQLAQITVNGQPAELGSDGRLYAVFKGTVISIR